MALKQWQWLSGWLRIFKINGILRRRITVHIMKQNSSLRSRIVWPFPQHAKRLLLHCCCAVCSGEIIESLLDSGITPTVFFSNDNIDSSVEYQKRKVSIENFAKKKDLDIIDDSYQPSDWQNFVKGLDNEPEGGQRCEQCFILRLNKAARCADSHGFCVFTSTLGISRYKNFDLVNRCGHKVAAQLDPCLIYWDYNWRKKGGSERMYLIAKQEEFYSQKYCGCVYSLRK
jgi:epoxyqueuosine reductase